jgi:hypothetical protein
MLDILAQADQQGTLKRLKQDIRTEMARDVDDEG